METTKTKVCFVLPALNAGGAQRIMSYLSQNMDKNKFDCTLLVIAKAESTDFDVSHAKVHYFDKDRLLLVARPLFLYLLKHKPDIVMGSIGHVNKLHAAYSFFLRKTKFIGREASINSIMSQYNRSTHITGFVWLFKNYRKVLKRIVCQSEQMATYMHEDHGIPKKRIHLINNPLTVEAKVKTPLNNKIKQLITVGRLSPEKGHERVLNILSKLDTDWHYTIIGEGNQYEKLMEQIKALHFEDKITYIKYTSHVAQYLSESDIFIQGSYVEGFPNAVMESCAVGTPVVAFEAPGGTKDIIQNGINGFIAKDEEEYLNYLNQALYSKKWDPNSVSKSITDKFEKKIILKKYEDMFSDIAQSK
ncbi:glycosyltransferase [Psychroserpens ponticola]|uniref:Glycosyltransferase n=1 Tax=Psychroserpens ponticola TaxID=2932268 RepID=A0ABY7S260_9FLAO|nr:glycosyltransferase [Psychroserpens ponticola]WCO03095.1 glycosyltransferase [Psychroserpens ponticola]